MDLRESVTKENLLRAFAGESQARNRYTFAASTCCQEKLHVLEAVFLYTAQQELAHAKVFYSHLKKAGCENVTITANYPVDLPEIARHFRQIAEIEKVHADRFDRFAKLMADGKLFVSDVETGWICLNCGHVFTGKQAPAKCPVCSHDQGYFIRLELSPYAK